MDNHKMITYSVPLLHNGEIYGILGVEISLKYLEPEVYYDLVKKDRREEERAGGLCQPDRERGQRPYFQCGHQGQGRRKSQALFQHLQKNEESEQDN